MGFLDWVSCVLGFMIYEIFEYGGVVGDFYGDVVMGFWGWLIVNLDDSFKVCKVVLVICCVV